MGKKILSALSGFIFTTQVATAAVTDGSAAGILPMLQQLIGVQITNPGVAIGTAAAFGLMVALVYSVLKLGAEKLELAESLTGGGGTYDEGRNILLIISVLIGLSTVGTGFFGTLVRSYGLISILLILVIGVVAFVAIGAFLTSGASGASKFASSAGKELQAQGMEAEASAKETKADAEKRKAKADKKMAELKDEAKKIREDIEKGDSDSEREAVEIEEDILEKIRNLVKTLDLEKDIGLTENAHEELKKELKLEGDEEGPRLGHASARINRANAYLNHIKNEVIDNIQTPSGGSVAANQFNYADILRQTPAAVSGAGRDLVLDDASGGMGGVRNDVLNQVQNNTANGEITYPGSHSNLGPGQLGGIEQSTRQRVKNDIGSGHGGSVDFSTEKWDYGICEAHEDLDKARKQLKAVAKGVEEEDELEGDAFKKVVEAVEDVKIVHNLVGELHDLLQELEDDDEMLEKLAKDQNWKDLFEEVEADEDSVEDLEEYLEHLKDLEKKAVPILEDVHETLEGIIDLDEKEIQRLDDDKRLIGQIVTLTTGGSDGGLENKFNEIENTLRGMSPSPLAPEQGEALSELVNLSSEIGDLCQNDILSELEAVEDVDKRDDSEARDMLHELEEIVG